VQNLKKIAISDTSREHFNAMTYTMTHCTKLLRDEPIWIVICWILTTEFIFFFIIIISRTTVHYEQIKNNLHRK